jgi:membrane protease YdiL (CAAX protease family)
MISTSLLWIKIIEKKSILDRLDLHLRSFQFLIYTIVFSIVYLYIRDNFGDASLILGGSILLPITEELFFRCYLLGSLMDDWPNFNLLSREEKRSFIRTAIKPLLLTSIAFALVHNDVIYLVINGEIGFMLFVLVIIRVMFGWAVGGIYILKKNISTPSILHIFFNITYYIFNP